MFLQNYELFCVMSIPLMKIVLRSDSGNAKRATYKPSLRGWAFTSYLVHLQHDDVILHADTKKLGRYFKLANVVFILAYLEHDVVESEKTTWRHQNTASNYLYATEQWGFPESADSNESAKTRVRGLKWVRERLWWVRGSLCVSALSNINPVVLS